MTIEKVVELYLCHSCGACLASCSQQAISFSETVAGYVFPVINKELCSKCGLCFCVCPGIHFGKSLTNDLADDPFKGIVLDCQIGKAVDENIYRNGQSGGVVTALLSHLLDTRQIVAAIITVTKTGYPLHSKAIVVKKIEDLCLGQKSKYIPIPILEILGQVKKTRGRIAIVGLPCHMHGLNNLCDLLPDYSEIEFLKIGLICDRVMLTSAVDFLSYNAGITKPYNFVWRDKNAPSYPGNPVVYDSSGERKILSSSLRISIKDYFTPVRCRLCFDKFNIFSDLTFGDPHGLDNVDRIGGETLVLVRTKLGQEIIASANSVAIEIRKENLDKALDGQKIRGKKRQFLSYMSAWQSFGKTLPKYPFEVLQVDQIGKEKKKIQHSIKLDTFLSREIIIRRIRRMIFIKKIFRSVNRQILIVRSFLRNVW